MRFLLMTILLVGGTVQAKGEVKTRRGEIEKIKGTYVLTDEKTGTKYNLLGFPPKAPEFAKPLDFYYLELKGRDVGCDKPAPCFEVTGYELVLYDPLSKDARSSAILKALPKEKTSAQEMGGKPKK